jgi:MFS family permease
MGALRHRDFRVLWIGSVVSNIGTWMHIVAQGWLMYQLTDSPLYLGLVGLMRAVPLLAFPLFGGVVADRVPRLRVLYVTQSRALLRAACLATATVMGVVQPWHILVFSFLNAAVLAFDNPARQAMLPDLVGRDDLMSAISLNSWAFNGAILVGPALAAALLPIVGMGGVFVQVHHVRHLKDLQRHRGRPVPAWVEKMAARHRKTLVACHDCHVAIHAGRAARERVAG